MISCLSIARTHEGCVRELNEDAFIERPDIGVWAVADGMGGHEAGDVASRLIMDMLAAVPVLDSHEQVVKTVGEGLSISNQRLRQMGRAIGNKIIGCTVVVLIIDNLTSRYTILWVGDSRVYRLRKQQLVRLTKDHTEAYEMLEQGYITEDQVETHPSADIVTRAIGAEQSLAIDRVDGHVDTEDVFLLCSDGLNKELSDKDIQTLLSTDNLVDSSKALIHSALLRKARDNVTVVNVKIAESVSSVDDGDTTINIFNR